MKAGSGPPGVGHNCGPPLEDPRVEALGRCRDCQHWNAPPEAEQRAYEWFRLGLLKRRARRPSGGCDRVVLSRGRAPVFAATVAEFGCCNFEPKPAPPEPTGGGYVTIYEAGRVVWEGAEDAVPAFRETEFDLFEPGAE